MEQARAHRFDTLMNDTITLTFEGGSGSGNTLPVAEVPRELGHVRLIKEVGRGAMGVVWRGQDVYLDRTVAIKIMHHVKVDRAETVRSQFLEGARAAAAVQHPNVVSVFHADELEEIVYIVMEFVGGPTLHHCCERHGRFDPEVAALVIHRSLEALEAIHAANVVHRDLKPSNVIFDPDGVLKVSDFGLSVLKRPSVDTPATVGGTPPYMAPEMFNGEASFQSDVYAVGIMYYELLTGVRPFRAETIEEYRHMHEDATVERGRLEAVGVGTEIIELIERAVHKRRIFRYKTAGHLRQALEDIYPRVNSDRALARRLEDLVLGGAAEPSATAPSEAPETPAATYFDLLSKRAEDKKKKRRE